MIITGIQSRKFTSPPDARFHLEMNDANQLGNYPWMSDRRNVNLSRFDLNVPQIREIASTMCIASLEKLAQIMKVDISSSPPAQFYYNLKSYLIRSKIIGE